MSVPRPVESRDPATGDVWRRYDAATSRELLGAVAAARAAQPGWQALPVAARARLLRAFHDALFRRRREVAALLSRETGKPTIEALAAEVAVALDFATFYAREAPRVLREGPWRTPTTLAMWRKRVRELHEPHGVAVVIAPWNYPFMLAAGVVLPALVAGNAVILKPSEFTPSSGAVLGELMAEAAAAVGAPAALLQIVQGAGDVGAALVAAPVDKVFFTGSAATGRRVAVACAERMVPCVLELGGSDPALVLGDADVAHAANGIAWGRFTNAGQTCVAPKRVLVAAPVYDRFLEALGAVVRRLRVGPAVGGADVGPLIRPSQRAELQAQLDDALARGARTLATAPPAPHEGGGAFFPPTVLVEVPDDARVLHEETFGPLLPVLRVADEAEAVARANASSFGLSASVWSRDRARAARVAARLEAGTVAVNDVVVVAGMADVAHGGVKGSGTGRAHGREGLLECVRTKTLVTDRWARWRQPWWFGYDEDSLEELDGFLQIAHGHGMARLGGVRRTLRLLRRRR